MRRMVKDLRGKERLDGSLVGHRKFGVLFPFFIHLLKQICAFVDMSNCSRGIVFSTGCKHLCIFYMHFEMAASRIVHDNKDTRKWNSKR